MISIIVPIYKIENYLPQCIESILSQTFQDFELILVDDGSPDSCPAICDEYAKKDHRIKVIHKSNGGLVSARKAGLQIAKGEYVGYVDGDDWIEPEFYERLMNAAVENEADIVAAGFLKDIGDNCTSKCNPIPCHTYSKDEIAHDIIPKMMFDADAFEPGLFTYVWNKVFRRSILYSPQMNVPNSISLGEDAACVYPAVLNANRICVTDDCLYHYRQRADSMLKVSDNYQDDYAGYRILHAYLSDCFRNDAVLKNSLDSFVLYLITTRCGGFLLQNNQFYLFDKMPHGKKLAIYGAGTLGQHLVKRLQAVKEYSIVKWVDIDYEILRTHGLSVDSPESIINAEFDDILIAFLDKNLATIIKQDLMNKGILEKKIISADFLKVKADEVLELLGVIK